MKICGDCKISKDLSEFYTNGSERHRPSCKPCTRLRLAACRFGLSVNSLQELYASQGGKCAICRRKCITYENLSVDHDHRCCPTAAKSCGKCVRGLLCDRCNRGLGMLDDSVEILENAIFYLNRGRIERD